MIAVEQSRTGRMPELAAAPIGRLLGSTVDDLPAAVRGFHMSNDNVAGAGVFRVEQASSRTGRLVARAMRMPRAAGDTPVRLSIVRQGSVECWRRSFGEEVMASIQTTDGQHLFERIGRVELRFDVTVECRRLRFRHVGTRLRIGRIRVRLPRSMSPTVAASVGAVGECLDVSVSISAPVVGPLFHYAGQLTPSGNP